MYSLPLLSRSTGMEGERSFSSASNNSASNEEHEYVWDGFTHGDQLVTPSDDYYEDLELAARLGKTLLQKNKELDTLNYQLRCCNEEQSLEIDHLNKQLTWLREVNESKTRMFEQLDVNYQELESANRKLKNESKEWKERVTKCMSVCESQEDQIQTLKSEIESIRKLHEGKKAKEKMRRRTIHGCLPTFQQEEVDVQKLLETSSEFSHSLNERERKDSTNDAEMAALHEVIGNLKAQQIMDKRMVKELRKELESVVQENQECSEKLQEEREMTQRLNRIIEEYDKVVYRQAFVAESTPNITAELTNNEINFSDHSEDEESIEQQNGINLVPRLGHRNKCSFNSPGIQVCTPMSQYLQIANSTPMKSPILSQTSNINMNDSCTNHATKSNTSAMNNLSKCHRSRVKSEPKNVSLVQELDTQYKTLLGKYEMLLHSIESERVATPTSEAGKSITDDTSSFFTESSIASEAGTSINTADISNVSRCSSVEAIPEYKRLFREIFNMINEAKV
ncbi:cerebellar degeneration-related protein 2-like [Styela clava]